MTLIPRLNEALAAAAPNLSPGALSAWVAAFDRPMQLYAINTPHRIAGFLGQCAEESGGFTELVEDLDYSAQAIVNVWPNRFSCTADAQPYARNPEKLANNVYASRMGNGPEASGDGWKFRGRGALQTTGRDSYTRLAAALGMSLDDCVAFMGTISGAATAACWDWQDMKCAPLADAWDLEGLTRRINGGLTALQAREGICNRVLAAVAGSTILVQDDTGPAVSGLETALQSAGFYAGDIDGYFGPELETGLRQFQNANNLQVDGVAGPATLKALGIAA